MKSRPSKVHAAVILQAGMEISTAAATGMEAGESHSSNI